MVGVAVAQPGSSSSQRLLHVPRLAGRELAFHEPGELFRGFCRLAAVLLLQLGRLCRGCERWAAAAAATGRTLARFSRSSLVPYLRPAAHPATRDDHASAHSTKRSFQRLVKKSTTIRPRNLRHRTVFRLTHESVEASVGLAHLAGAAAASVAAGAASAMAGLSLALRLFRGQAGGREREVAVMAVRAERKTRRRRRRAGGVRCNAGAPRERTAIDDRVGRREPCADLRLFLCGLLYSSNASF